MNIPLAPRLRASFDAWIEQPDRPVGSAWVQTSWTLAAALAFAAVLTVLAAAMTRPDAASRSALAWARTFGQCVVVSTAISIAIQLLFAAGRCVFGASRIGRFGARPRCAYRLGVSALGVSVGLWVGLALVGGGPGRPIALPDGREVARSFVVGAVSWGLLSAYFSVRHRQLLAERRLAQAQLERLQAQIEPHFLFNTLANVVGLIDVDAPRAKRMLESFTDYLRGSFGDLRGADRTLGDELDRVAAYLGVVALRMEDRLRVEIAVDAPLRALALPPFCLQPLVENAVVHGLEPSVEGGRISIRGDIDGERLVLRVVDDGAGLGTARPRPGRGHGTAISNIRERLRQLHGEAGRLELTSVHPHGTCATLSVPAAFRHSP